MCPPGLGVRLDLRARRSTTRPSKPAAATTSTGARTPRPSARATRAFTPAVSLFLGLDIALDMILEEGLENVFARHALLARATRAGAAAIGLEIFGDADERSTVVTAIELPDSIDGAQAPRRAAQARDHRQRRPGAAQGPDPADRPLRLLRRLRHPDLAVGPRDGALPARLRGRARRRRRRRPARLRRGRRRARPPSHVLEQQYQVLVKEKIADSGVDMLRERFAVDVGVDWTDEELAERIGGYHGILIRSATKLTADLIGRADNLRVIGRAGIGVDNVDVEAATKRGIIVANAPQSNIVAAAEHTVALMLSLARNIPQAHASLTAGRWERSKFGGVEVYEKTLGRARLRPHRPARGRRARRASACACSPSTRSSPPSASASSASTRPRRAPTSTARPTSSPSTCPRRPRRAAGSTPRRSRR